MTEPFVYLAHASREAGLLCAVVQITVEKCVYGWYTGAQGPAFPAAFFMLEDYYSPRDTVFYRSLQDDVYDGWAIVNPLHEVEIDRPVPVPEQLCHELEHVQSLLAQEWLFYADDPESQAEIESYRKDGLAIRPVNIKHRKLNKLERRDPVSSYATPGLDLNVIDFLKKNWSLDYSS